MASTGPDNDDRDELSRSLYAARRAAGLGQVEAAKRAGTSQNKVSRVENGKGLLTVAEAEALLTVYSVYGGERHRMLDDPSRQWVLLQAEGALRWNLGGSGVMVEQIEGIATAIDRPNVRLGIIPWQTPAQVLPLHGFHLYDRRAVVLGTRSGTAIIERDVPDYEALFGELARLAVFDDEARVVLVRITDDYRSL